MVRFLVALLLLVTAPVVARSKTDPDQLYALVQAQEIQTIGALLSQARKDDLVGPTEFPAQRALFAVFGNSDPAIDQLTEAWLKQAPDDPNALVARSIYLHGMGWNYRGDQAAYLVPEINMETMTRLHNEAFRLAGRAVSLAADMAAASDMLILAALTINRRDEGFAEFQRFMSLHPNRGTLMREALTLSPQWGGGIAYIKALCAAYAQQIRSVPDYTVPVCVADAVYFAQFPEGPDKAAALEILGASTNPVLDGARERATHDGQGPLLWRLAILSRIRETRALDDVEIGYYEYLLANPPGPRVQIAPPQPEPIDFARDLAWRDPAAGFPKDPLAPQRAAHLQDLKLKADRDPLNPKTVATYVKAKRTLIPGPLDPAVKADLSGRIKRVLVVLPYNAPLWHELSVLMATDEPTLDQIDAAGRAADNAFFYSGLLSDNLSEAIFIRLSHVMKLNARPQLKETGPLDAATLARRDQILHCPLLRDLRLAMSICPDPAHFGKKCLRGGMMDLPMGTLMAFLTEAAARSGCKAGEVPISLLLPKAPMPYDLSAE